MAFLWPWGLSYYTIIIWLYVRKSRCKSNLWWSSKL